MKKYIIILIAFPLLFTQCIKDELVEIKQVGSSDVTLYINEVVSKGTPDWLELYNGTNAEIDLTGFSVEDPGAKYIFAAGTKIASKGYLIVLCDKGDVVDAEGIHSNFKISASGENLKFKDASGKLIDELDVPPLDENIAWGRTADGADQWQTMSSTQGAANSTENNLPILIAEEIVDVNDLEAYKYTVIASDADGIRSVKLFLKETVSAAKIIEILDQCLRQLELALGEYEDEIAREDTMLLFVRYLHKVSHLAMLFNVNHNFEDIITAIQAGIKNKDGKPYTREEIATLRNVVKTLRQGPIMSDQTYERCLDALDKDFKLGLFEEVDLKI